MTSQSRCLLRRASTDRAPFSIPGYGSSRAAANGCIVMSRPGIPIWTTMNRSITATPECGGKTVASNMSAFCRNHHRLKHSDRWRFTSNEDRTMSLTSRPGIVTERDPQD